MGWKMQDAGDRMQGSVPGRLNLILRGKVTVLPRTGVLGQVQPSLRDWKT